ncbi:chemotaxis protein CheW [Actinoplanes sp. LDG1-06]|uniref:Chemotaxis protein CheW n=1 Tax=Paractinoplanes ovalisporus TaxID=2810368 RepID=A0ABS2AF55_9ACTN|nr:chemotaxis protein CheW [Actinoplanes ovalisporus]MBM2618457.1 chemotaxis protein CheW [Actinoplanes ovalisporus]
MADRRPGVQIAGDPADRSSRTYRADAEVATPLTQIADILAYPPDVSPLAGATDGVLGLFTHRRSVVSLVCLNRRVGRPPATDPATSRVLLVEHAGNHIGYVVDSLGAIEDSVWQQDTTGPGAPGRLDESPLVQIGADPDGRLLPRVDLAARAESLSPSGGQGPAAAPESDGQEPTALPESDGQEPTALPESDGQEPTAPDLGVSPGPPPRPSTAAGAG